MSASAKVLGLYSTPEFVQAKPVNLALRSSEARLTEWVKEKAREQNHGQMTLLNPAPAAPFEQALQMLILNILLQPKYKFFALSKSWSDYPPASRYNPSPLPLSAVIAATEFLQERGWIIIHPGSRELALKTRLEVTDSFYETALDEGFLNSKIETNTAEEVVVLRDSQRKLLDYTDTARTLTMRRQLHSINAFLKMQTVMFAGRRLKTHLVRIFKDNFLQGGRFYRAEHLSLKSSERGQITLNGEEVTEIDFSCLHINMLYIRETGRPFDGDAYDTSTKDVSRDVNKIILQIILNCESEMSAVLAANEAFRSRDLHVSAEKAVHGFLKKHQAISKYFFTGVGLQLQYEDSLIAERVLLQAIQANIPVLPVHDSFLAPKSQQDWLLNAMNQASFEVLGALLPVKIKKSALPSDLVA